jgi:bacterial leucyl aminopeptidase
VFTRGHSELAFAGYARGMRSYVAALALVIGCSRAPHEAREIIISIGNDAVATAQSVAAAHGETARVLETDADFSVLAIDPAELGDLGVQMHEQFHRCGGFLVHDSLADAHAVVAQRPAPGYTIDRPAMVKAVLPALEPARILRTIEELSAMPSRHYQSPTGAEASYWLRDRWRSLTTRSDVTVDLVDHGWPQQSVVMTIPGTTRASEVIVIGGHLDSINLRGATNPAPGADDDASGIATVTEIARVLLASDYRPERTIQFMAYAAEEVGLRGSQAIAKDYQKRGVNVVGVMQLDMTNYQGSEKDIWLMKDFTNPAQNEFVGKLIDTYTDATWGVDACGYGCSDHASWYRTGVPASMPFESRMKQYNKSIHTPNDTLERSGNNAAHAIKFARLGAAYAIEMGKGKLGGESTASLPTPTGHPWKLITGLLGGLALGGWWLRRRAATT